MNMFVAIIPLFLLVFLVAGVVDVKRIRKEADIKTTNVDIVARNISDLQILDIENNKDVGRWSKAGFERMIERKQKIYQLLKATTMTNEEIEQKVKIIDGSIIKDLEFQFDLELQDPSFLPSTLEEERKEVVNTIHQLLKDSMIVKLKDYLASKDLYHSSLKEIINAIQLLKS